LSGAGLCLPAETSAKAGGRDDRITQSVPARSRPADKRRPYKAKSIDGPIERMQEKPCRTRGNL
jgi:hypothetical protein